MATVYTVAAGIIGIIVAILSFFGIRELQGIPKIRKEMENEARESIKGFEEQAKEFEEQFNKLIDDARKKLEEAGKKLSEAQDTETNLLIESLLEGFNVLVDDVKAYDFSLERINEILKMNISNTRILAAVHGRKAYILKRKDRFAEALASIEEAHRLNPKNVIILYNCACYASLLISKKDKALDYLEELVKKVPEWKNAIIKDEGTPNMYKLLEEDFKNIRDESRFKEILGVSTSSIINWP